MTCRKPVINMQTLILLYKATNSNTTQCVLVNMAYIAERDRQRQSTKRLYASKTLINFTPPLVIKFILSKLDMPLTACLTPVLLKLVAAKETNFVCNCVVLECAKESNSYMISQWPIDPTECVSEGILCPVLPASLTP